MEEFITRPFRFAQLIPAVGVLVYWGGLERLKGFRTDHLAVGICILVLWYGGRRTRNLFRFLFPVLLTGIVYDSQRFYSNFLRGHIHVRFPYLFDKKFFGIQTSHGVLTPNEWCQLHTSPVLDLVTGFMYLGFILLFVLVGAYFFFYLKREKTLRMMWGFFWLNVLGYSTYYWFAAAPPWYVARYGLGPARLSVHSNPAGCVRFDHLLGTHFFTGMYGRAADVFGSIPSLHVAYPFLALMYAYYFGAGRVVTFIYFALMCFSAVYLDHHYILDILWGVVYAALVGGVTLYWGRAKRYLGVLVFPKP